MKIQILYLIFLILFCPVLFVQGVAQGENAPYTGKNTVIITLEGIDQRYEFISNQMLVRHNKERHALECVIPVASLIPLNDTIPPGMAYEVLFGAKYPELFVSIAEPEQQTGTDQLNTSVRNRTTTIRLQGVTNQTLVPVAVLSDKNSFYFSTNFDLMLGNFQASLPVKYLPVLTGRVLFRIDKAYWYDLAKQ